jgi:hypothetical protein
MLTWLRTSVILLAMLLLTRFIPFSGFFRNVNTLIHELCHAIAALVLKGSVMRIELNADQSGVTLTRFQEGWMSIPISLAGYTGAAAFAALLLALFAKGRVKAGLFIVAAAALVSLVLFVRNGYGMMWCAGFAAVSAAAAFAPGWLQKGYFLLVAFLCLEEAVVSPLVLVYLAVTDPAAAGDAANLSGATGVPAIVWSVFFLLFSLVCAKAGLNRLFVRDREQAAMTARQF